MQKFKLILWFIRVNYIQFSFIVFFAYFIIFQFIIRSIFNF